MRKNQMTTGVPLSEDGAGRFVSMLRSEISGPDSEGNSWECLCSSWPIWLGAASRSPHYHSQCFRPYKPCVLQLYVVSRLSTLIGVVWTGLQFYLRRLDPRRAFHTVFTRRDPPRMRWSSPYSCLRCHRGTCAQPGSATPTPW